MPPGSEPFIAAIIARPDDDLPRLIFADWLDENGESERAEFIRVQCELALDCPPDAPYCLDKTHRRLRVRERELLNRHESKWLRGSPLLSYTNDGSNGGGGGHYTFRPVFHRGFVSEITCSWSDWQRHASEIRAATPLRKVRLTTYPEWGGFQRRLDNPDGSDGTADWLRSRYPGIEFELPRQEQPEDVVLQTVNTLSIGFRDIASHLQTLPNLGAMFRNRRVHRSEAQPDFLNVASTATISRRDAVLMRSARVMVDTIRDTLLRLLREVATFIEKDHNGEEGLILARGWSPRFTVVEDHMRAGYTIHCDCSYRWASKEYVEELRGVASPVAAS